MLMPYPTIGHYLDDADGAFPQSGGEEPTALQAGFQRFRLDLILAFHRAVHRAGPTDGAVGPRPRPGRLPC